MSNLFLFICRVLLFLGAIYQTVIGGYTSALVLFIVFLLTSPRSYHRRG